MLLPEIPAELGVPSNHRIGYVMLFGKPDVTYYRNVQPKAARINRARV
ncbi:MAG: hypothetical protein V1793_13910 [Pseudomonadota bacterium]